MIALRRSIICVLSVWRYEPERCPLPRGKTLSFGTRSCDPLAHRFIGHASVTGTAIVGHVLGVAGPGYRAGNGRVTDYELEQELWPARAVECLRPSGAAGGD